MRALGRLKRRNCPLKRCQKWLEPQFRITFKITGIQLSDRFWFLESEKSGIAAQAQPRSAAASLAVSLSASSSTEPAFGDPRIMFNNSLFLSFSFHRALKRPGRFIETVLLSSLLAISACSTNETAPSSEGSSSAGGQATFCEEGALRSCSIKFEQGNGQLQCFYGTQECSDEAWGPCGDGSTRLQVDPTNASNQNFFDLKSLSSAASCALNSACDGLPAWQGDEVTNYANGDVLQSGGSYYQCSDTALCGGEAGISEPGVGSDWEAAWTLIGSCSGQNACDPNCMYFEEDPEDITGGTGSPGEYTPPPIPNDWPTEPGMTTCATADFCDDTAPNLDPTCHPCVAQVCDADPGCCSDATRGWDATCVSLVYSECAGSGAPPSSSTPTSVCDHGLFSEADLSLGNDFGLVGGSVAANGDLEVGNDDRGEVLEELIASGSISIGDRAEVGRAQAGGSITKGSDTVIGIESPNTSSSIAATVPEKFFSCNTTGIDRGSASGTVNDLGAGQSILMLNSGARLELAPGSYNNVRIQGAILELTEAGEYFFDGLTFPGSGFRIIIPDSGVVKINICSELSFENESNGTANQSGVPLSGADALRLQFYTNQTSPLTVGPGAALAGIFMAPKADVTIASGNSVPTYSALVFAQSIETTGSQIHFDVSSMTGEACRAAGGDGNICSGLPLWVSGGSYSSGARVRANDDRIYECQSDLVPLWSSGGAYASGDKVRATDNKVYTCVNNAYRVRCPQWDPAGPNGSLPWGSGVAAPASCASSNPTFLSSAWSDEGACTFIEEPVLSCPVTTIIPETQSWRTEPCETGRDCQVNHACTSVSTSPTCGHSKCDTGAALDSSCDECVARICERDAACCGASWNQACVDQVETVCDATCGENIESGCGHDLCVEGPPLAVGCDAAESDCVSQVCAVYPNCCDLSGSWDAACVAEVYNSCASSTPPAPLPPLNEGENICDYAILGSGSADALGLRILGGDVGWQGDGVLPGGSISIRAEFLGLEPAPYIDGNIYGVSTQIVGATVTGDVRTETSPSIVSSNVAGSTTMGIPPYPNFPEQTQSCPTGGANNTGGTRTLGPGTYGALAVNNGKVLTLQAGVYNIKSLNLKPNSRVELPAVGDVTINVCNNVSIQQGVVINSPGNDSLQLDLFQKNGSLTIGNNVELEGAFRTDGGVLTIGTDALVYGLVHNYSGQLTVGNRVTIDSSGFDGVDCLNRGVDPDYDPVVCPVITPEYGSSREESGLCVANGNDHQVDTDYCAGVDLAVDMPCGEQIPVCNHGNQTLAAGEAELLFYPKAAQQFATETPDAAWLAGSCAIDEAIPAGSCIQQTCAAALLSEDLTVQVQLLDSAATSECSLLDNWSYYEDGIACSDSSGPSILNYTYESSCPEDSIPAWGILNWNTSTPGTSSVAFRARAGASLTELNGAFTDLGIAQMLPDTQVCDGFTPSGSCPVDLTLGIWGFANLNQPAVIEGDGTSSSALELQVEMIPSDSDAPILRDWQVSYTCVLDQ